MPKNNRKILILEDDAYFRTILQDVCEPLGLVFAVGDIETALDLLEKQSFQLLLLDWHLNQIRHSPLFSFIENFQASAKKIALFTVPDLPNVISAIKAGNCDILWAAQDKRILREKIKECLSQPLNSDYAHSFISHLIETLTDKAMIQKTTFFQARREFSKTFLHQILSQQKFKRTQLASLMSVSPRTLHRHLSA
jgi:DNA-binding NtrC family response regulator